jgi:hypothetical protein
MMVNWQATLEGSPLVGILILADGAFNEKFLHEFFVNKLQLDL